MPGNGRTWPRSDIRVCVLLCALCALVVRVYNCRDAYVILWISVRARVWRLRSDRNENARAPTSDTFRTLETGDKAINSMRIYRDIMRFDRAPRIFLFVKRERALDRWPECSRFPFTFVCGFTRGKKKKYPKKKPPYRLHPLNVYAFFSLSMSFRRNGRANIGVHRYTYNIAVSVYETYHFIFNV